MNEIQFDHPTTAALTNLYAILAVRGTSKLLSTGGALIDDTDANYAAAAFAISDAARAKHYVGNVPAAAVPNTFDVNVYQLAPGIIGTANANSVNDSLVAENGEIHWLGGIAVGLAKLLDTAAVAPPASKDVTTWTFREMQVMLGLRFFGDVILDRLGTTIRTYDKLGNVLAQQPAADDGVRQTIGRSQ